MRGLEKPAFFSIACWRKSQRIFMLNTDEWLRNPANTLASTAHFADILPRDNHDSPPTHEILNPMLGIDIQAISIFVDLAMSNPQQMCPHNFIGPQIFHLLIDNAPIMDVPKLF